MRRLIPLLVVFFLLMISCQAVTQPLAGLQPGESSPATAAPASSSEPAVTQTVSPSVSPSPASSPTVAATTTATETVTATGIITATGTAPATPVSGEDFEVRFHPDGGLYVGDQVSLEVISPPGANLQGDKLQVQVEGMESTNVTELSPVEFAPFGIAGRYQATLTWAWDTSGLQPGDYILDFSIQPAGIYWNESVALGPAANVPPPEEQANWATTETDCCIVYYITGTAAERDLPVLETMIDAQAADAARRLNTNFDKALPIVLLSRVLGHGGFTGDSISVSYLDRNYAGSTSEMVLHHEMIHLLDGRLGGELRPTIFVEGLAVYLTGGHFKPEALMPRAAVLLDTGRYLPLVSLSDNFYASQHESGYLEAASLIEYMVNEWGWQAVSDFYRDIHPAPDKKQSTAIDVALQKHFNLSFKDLENQFTEALRRIPVTDEIRDDVRLTLDYYDTVRRYQLALDPSAYFATAWLPSAEEMRKRGIVADYVRHPDGLENQALEAMLVSAGEHLEVSEYTQTDQILKAVNATLDGVKAGEADPFSRDPLATDAFAITQALTGSGYDLQRVEIAGETAQAWAIQSWPTLQQLDLEKGPYGWQLRSTGENDYKEARKTGKGPTISMVRPYRFFKPLLMKNWSLVTDY